jgi:tRNA threonylcarbamoyladenosine biosynthesis protein TsaB
LAFDTATSFGAVCAVTPGRRGRAARAGDLLVAVDGLVDDPSAIEGIVVGRGPGSFTSIRIGLAMARTLALALDVPVAGASTLEAFATGTPVLDARRGEVFATGTFPAEPMVCKPQELDVTGRTLVGDGAIRYRTLFEANGAAIPPDDDSAHVPDPLLLVERAGAFGVAELVEPLYVRDPDAKDQV